MKRPFNDIYCAVHFLKVYVQHTLNKHKKFNYASPGKGNTPQIKRKGVPCERTQKREPSALGWVKHGQTDMAGIER